VVAALGRAVTAAEAKNIEDRIAKSMRSLARENPEEWMALSSADRLARGGERAAADLVAEAHLKQYRQSLGILAQAKLIQYMQESAPRGIDGLDALKRVTAFMADGKSNFLSIESRTRAIRNDALRQMLTTMESTNPKFFGLFENEQGVKELIRELYGEHTGNADAKAGAAEFHKVAEQLRQRFNRAGGDVGQLESWAIPQHHSQAKVAKAGVEQWLTDTLPKMDRSMYVNEDGSRMDDIQLNDFLRHAWETIATGGALKVDPGQFKGGSMRANRGNESRQIHFKDAASYIDYQNRYGDRSLYQVILGHIEGVSKDVALVETMGPNPDQTFRYLADTAFQQLVTADPTQLGKLRERYNPGTGSGSLADRYNIVAGKTDPVASELLARSFDTLRSWLIASRLGSSVITSFSDEATLHLTSKINGLSEMRLLANQMATLDPSNRMEERMAQRAGLSLNTLIASLNRFGQGELGAGFSSRLANTVMRVSFLNAWTEARKRAFGVTMMGSIGGVVKDHPTLSDIDAADHRMLLSKGISETDFAVWKRAELENWGNGNDTMLTPESIYRIPDAQLEGLGNPQQLKADAATRLLGAILEETDVAVIEPGVNERAQMAAVGAKRGTWKGEIMRSFFLFKSFPMAMIERHISRGMNVPSHGGKAAYLASLMAATTVLGAASLQVDQVLQGKDPRNLDAFEKGGVKNWIAALMKGGSLGIYGDFLFSDASQHGGSPFATIAGPLAGEAEELLNLTQGNLIRKAQGKDVKEGAGLVHFVRGVTPGASLWYAKGALDHLIFHQLQEYFSPGYLANLRAKAQRDYGQQYYWQPGQAMPDRAPDLGAAVGQ
jgi:hypothetical protein